MKFTKNVPTDFNVKFLGFSVPADSNDFYSEDPDAVKRFNQYNKKDDILECLIDIDLGTVVAFTANEVNILCRPDGSLTARASILASA